MKLVKAVKGFFAKLSRLLRVIQEKSHPIATQR